MDEAAKARIVHSVMRELFTDDDDQPRPLTEAIIHELRVIFARYQRACPFDPGQLVTPRRGSTVTGVGDPHIVVEVFDPPIRSQSTAGSNADGRRFDMRVVCYHPDFYAAHMVESWEFEPWDALA